MAARRIYRDAGLQLIEEQPHDSWGKTLVGETSVLDLHEGMHG